jgi:endonuclease/exonuclease/phosphatase family metal-dependent hydrolase
MSLFATRDTVSGPQFKDVVDRSGEPSTPAMMLKVASYNIRKAIGSDRVRRPERILDVLEEIDADVIALQEADRRFGARTAALPALLLAQSHWSPVPLGRASQSLGWHGNAILVRTGLAVQDCGHIDLPTIEPRGAVFADVDVSGHIVRIVGMHLDLSGLRRRQQARAILHALERKAPLPTVLMGDLNEWRRTGGCLADFSHHHAMALTGRSFPASRPLARLDRIMASRDLHIESAAAHLSAKAKVASDHLPVWARIDVAGASR